MQCVCLTDIEHLLCSDLPASFFHDVQTASATCQSLAAEVEFY